MLKRMTITLLFAVVITLPIPAQPTNSSSLRVGAARMDITPPENALPEPYTSILDHIYARVIVVDNGVTRGVFVSADVASFSDPMYQSLSRQIASEVACPVEQILMTGTHTHSSPPPGAMAGSSAAPDPDLNTIAHGKRAEAAIMDAVRQAKAKLQPARVAFGNGQAYFNVNRDAIETKNRTWYQGPNAEASSDKTVGVVKFETLTGDPIAVYVNYAMHAVHYYMRNEISADFPGVMSRYIEQNFDDKVVAIWSAGAAGDQNPLYLRLSEPAVAPIKRAAIKAAGGPDDPTVQFTASYRNVKIDPKILNGNVRIVNSVGTLLGEEVIRVMGSMARAVSQARIWGAQKVVTCPGRKRTNTGREGMPGTYEDTEPASVRIGLLMIGQIGFASIGAEPYNTIALRLKKESPVANLIVTTLANGQSAGYIPTDDAYGHQTFQVLGSRFKPGCAETGIIDGILEMMTLYLK
jgi:neutral ceramidase